MSAPATASESTTGFRQQLGLFDATMLVAGSMIGSGIFIVSADIARDVGSTGWLLFIWALTGVMTVIGALAYAELAAMMPQAGGQYVYLREAYGPLPAFLYGWTNFLIIQTGFIAAVGVAFAKFLGVLVPQLGADAILWETPLAVNLAVPVAWMEEPLTFFKRDRFAISAGQLVAVAIAVFLTILNCRGIREGKLVQNVFTVAKTLALVGLVLVGLLLARNALALELNFSDLWTGILQTPRFDEASRIVPVAGIAVVLVLSGAMVGSLFSADAWGNVTFIAGEIKEPRRNLPWSLVLGTGLVVLLYFLANVAYVSSLPMQGTTQFRASVDSLDDQAKKRDAAGDDAGAAQARAAKKTALAEASAFERGIANARDDRVATAVLEQVSPNFGVSAMAIAIMISTFGCVNGIVLAGARLYYAMAQDGLFFKSVGRLNERGVPAAGLILQGLWSIVLIFSGSYSELLDYVIFAALVFYVLTVGGLFVLRRKRPEWPRPYRAFGYPVIPAIYVILCAVIMLSLLVIKPVYSWPSFIIVLAGIPVYLLWRKQPLRSSA